MAQQINNADQEIDLAEVSRKIRGTLSRLGIAFFNMLLFIKRNFIILVVLFIIGAGLGYYLDRKTKVYDHQIIVIPNFGSSEYLYSKVNLLAAKLKERDTLFLKSLGIKKPKSLLDIEIEPINNVYDFVNQRPTNFELLKLMAEDGNVSKVIEDPTTSKNYTFHNILLSTKNKADAQTLINPLLAYLNDSDYFKQIQQQEKINLEIKLKENDSIIKQIDGVVNSFSARGGASAKTGSLVYNENTELSNIIKNKDELINEKAGMRITKINHDKIIKDTSITLNIRNKEGVNGKAKFVLPIVFIFLFFMVAAFISFIKTQSQLRKSEQ